MEKKTERSRVLVAARSLRENNMTGIAILAAAFAVVALAIFTPALARAETPPPPAGFTPGTFDGGTEVAPSGHYFFPGGWKEPPKNSTAPAGEGFPQVTGRVNCTVKVTAGAVSVACPELERFIKGRWRGQVGITTWPEIFGITTENPVATTRVGVFVYFETSSIPGHIYHLSVSASPAGHTKEMVFTCEAGGSAEVTFDVQFVHQDQDVVAKPPTPAKK